MVFFSVSGTLGVRWLSATAHAGPVSITLWAVAAATFLIPLAFAVARLAAKYPEQGGLYLWAKRDFGPWHGFLCFWLYWIGIAFWFPNAMMAYSAMAVYALGPGYLHLADNRLYVVGTSLVMLWLALGSHYIGLRYGRWTQWLGSVGSYGIGLLLIAVAALIYAKRGSATELNVWPKGNWETVNFWSQIAFALTGLEMAPMMGSEIHEAERNLPRSSWVTAVACAAYYSLATAALLVLLTPENINILHGLAAGGRVAGLELGVPWFGALFAVLIVCGGLGQFGALGAAAARLPFVVGLDRYFPASFARLHPRYHTPHRSILLLASVASVFLVLLQLGETLRAAYQLLIDLMVLATFVPFCYIFLSAWKAGLRVSAILGLLVSALALLFSLVPTADVRNVWLFEAKLLGGTLALVGLARWIFVRAQRADAVESATAIV